MGGRGDVAERKAINTTLGVFLLDPSHSWPVEVNVDLVKARRDKIEAAKAKLNAEEKELLGIK